jgi:putative heme-binding domain-containing protein
MRRDSQTFFLKHPILWAIVALLASSGQLIAQEHAGQYSQADVENGFRLYGAHCSACHGADGDSVAGIDLRRGQFRRVTSDADLNRIIATGIPGTAMPPNRFVSADLAGLVAYIRSMRDFDARAVALGDAARGEALFAGKGGCATCHRVNGNGSRFAPDLSDIGAIRAPDSLQQSVLDPNTSVLPINRSVRAVTRDGKVISGRRLNEDTYTVQLIDEQERLVSLDKAGLREYTVVKTSSMPSYKDKLTSEELSDLVAYLRSLKGSR